MVERETELIVVQKFPSKSVYNIPSKFKSPSRSSGQAE